MTSFDRIERSLPTLLDDLAAPRTPDYLDDILTRTAATRQRPGWTFPERWLPMSTITRRLAAAPRITWRMVGAVALLILTLVVGLIVAGSRQPRLPAPFGPAANGQIAYVDSSGAIAVGDVQTGSTQVVIPGPVYGSPVFSADGSRLAFTSLHSGGGGFDIKVARADGADIRALNATPVAKPTFLEWSPAGTYLAVTTPGGMLELFDTTKTGDPTVLTGSGAVTTAEVGSGDFNAHVASLFRPPHGDELLFVNRGADVSLSAMRPDGSALRAVIDQGSSGLGYADLKAAQWSPDGALVVVMMSFPVDPNRWHLYLVNADGTGLRPLNASSNDPLLDEGNPAWSPDGGHIAFQRWSILADGSSDYHPIGIVEVATGAMVDVGPTSTNGFLSWAWSPDGTAILEAPQDDSGNLLIVNIASGKTGAATWSVRSGVSWQRVAP